MKLLIDIMPAIFFYAGYYFQEIFFAAGIYIAATLVQALVTFWLHRSVPIMLWVQVVIVCMINGWALTIQNSTLVLLQPTLVYWANALVLFFSLLVLKKNIIQTSIGNQAVLPPIAWLMLNLSWLVFLLVLGALNYYVALSFSEVIWVNYKLFGGMILIGLFVLAQGMYLSQYITDNE